MERASLHRAIIPATNSAARTVAGPLHGRLAGGGADLLGVVSRSRGISQPWYLAAIEFIPQFLYPFLWLGLVGLPVWRWRWPLARRLQGWRLPGFLKFMLLGYMMVLLEEVFAALVNHLAEGFSWPLFLQRIGQFWAFNLLGFTGYFVGWYLLARLLWPVLRACDLSPARAAAAISPLRPAHDLHLWPDPGASGAQPL